MKKIDLHRVAWLRWGLGIFLSSTMTSFASTNTYIDFGRIELLPTPSTLCTRFGHDVDRVGDKSVIVSAPGGLDGVNSNGCVYVFDEWGSRVSTVMNPATFASSAMFGYAIAGIDAQRFVVGSPGFEPGADDNRGVAYVYATNGVQLSVLANPAANPAGFKFGSSLAVVNPGRIVVGAPGADGGRGRVYVMSPAGAALATVTNPLAIAGMEFGTAVTRVGPGFFAVGTRLGERVFLYSIDGQLVRVIADPGSGSDFFGLSISEFSGERLLIGAYGYNSSAVNDGGEGLAYVFNTNGVLERVLGNPAGPRVDTADKFGFAVAAFGPNYGLVGAPYTKRNVEQVGVVYMIDAAGAVIATIVNPANTPTSEFGWSVATINTNAFVVGSPRALLGPPEYQESLGLAYIFHPRVIAPDPFEPDDSQRQARSIRMGEVEIHDFHEPGDEDWVKFFVHSNFVYTVQIEPLGQVPPGELFLLRERRDGSLEPSNALLVPKHKSGDGSPDQMPTATSIVISNALTGFYYIPISASDTNAVGAVTKYSIEVSSEAAGTVLVILAIDLLSEYGENSPPGSEALVTGYTNTPFNGENAITMTGITPGDYVVEVTYPPGYAPDEDPALPGQVTNMNSLLFGNPKNVSVLTGQYNFAIFTFLPLVTAKGLVRDGDTGAWLNDAQFNFHSQTGLLAGISFTQFPNFAVWADLWRSSTDGRFPGNLHLPLSDFDLDITRDGYEMLSLTNAIQSLAPGDTNDFDVLYLFAHDTNSNGIADWWEDLHFMGLANPTNDSDGDGYDDLAEYLLGTDPTNSSSALGLMSTNPLSASPFVLCWPAMAGREYEVVYKDIMSVTSHISAFGPWIAPSNGTKCWTDEGTFSVTGRFYRLNVTFP